MTPDPETSVSEKYVAFCDILGFSGQIDRDFRRAVEAYDAFMTFLEKVDLPGVEVTVYSDAVLIACDNLMPLLQAVNGLWFSAQTHFFLIRGGISKGAYWERRSGRNLFVASNALVRAVNLEKDVIFPMVAVDDQVDIPIEVWIARFEHGPLMAPLLHFWGRNIVNPFGRYWFASAKGRISVLNEGNPRFVHKYEWLLALHKAIEAHDDLVPPNIVSKLLELGVIAVRGSVVDNSQ